MSIDERDIIYKLGEISSTLGSIDDHLAALNSKVAKHESALNTINLAFAKFGGGVIVVTAVFGFIWALVAETIQKKLGF